MKINLRYNKKSFTYFIKIDKFLFISLSMNKLINKNLSINMSLKTYNYMLLIKLLRIFGLIKPLLNKEKF